MPKKRVRNYTIKYNFSMGKDDMKKIMEDSFIKYFNHKQQNHTFNQWKLNNMIIMKSGLLYFCRSKIKIKMINEHGNDIMEKRGW